MPATQPVDAKKKKPVSRSKRAKLVFSVSRVHNYLRKCNRRVGSGAPVYLAAVVEYVVAEVLELAAREATKAKHVSINGQDINLALRTDKELNALFADATVSGGGVVPNIARQLLPKKHVTATTAVVDDAPAAAAAAAASPPAVAAT